MELGVQIDDSFRDFLSRERLQRVLEIALSDQVADSEVELGLLITDDETVQRLNREYRGIDETTDVLSFALTEERTDITCPSFVTPPDGLLHLGEIIVSYPQAARQAQDNRQAIEKEITLLVIHGALHLMGYDHAEAAEENEMRALEEKILSEVERILTGCENGVWQ